MRIVPLLCLSLVLAVQTLVSASATAAPRCLMYLTGQHAIVPDDGRLVRHITHVAMAFLNSGLFNGEPVRPGATQWPLFASIPDIRAQFQDGTKVLVAIGGWGDTAGFDVAARDASSRSRWAKNVAVMVEDLGADGVDVDWEYPGGNGEDYKKVPNSKKEWEIEAYPLLLKELRHELGPDKLITAATPGLERDMMAFTPETVPEILNHLDFMNVMTYDLLNRRDNVTKHHTGLELSRQSIEAYMARGAPPEKLNLGFAFYVKWVYTEPCPNAENPIGCPTLLLEDPDTGTDMGQTGGFSYHDGVPGDVAQSFQLAKTDGVYDEEDGGYYYWDGSVNRWWTFDTPDAILRKFPSLVSGMGLGGVFAWGLGEDAPDFAHLAAVNKGIDQLGGRSSNGKEDNEEHKDKESKARKRLRNHFEL